MRAARRDLPALTRLWQACFGDTEAEVRAFWQALFDCTPVYLRRAPDGSPAAMLCALPAELVGDDGDAVPAAYLYAVCTAPALRGRGHCRLLLQEAEQDLAEQDVRAAVLVPAEVLNIPLAFLCYKLLGRGFFLRSMRCMVISSIFIDYIGPMLPAYDGDRLLAALCTGVTMGVGYALIYMQNSSTGGADFVVMAMKAVRPHLSLGKLAFVTDVAIVLAGGFLFRDVDGIIYGMIVSFLFSAVIDKVMYGANAGKLALVVTTQGTKICQVIDDTCKRGSTILNSLYKERRNTCGV